MDTKCMTAVNEYFKYLVVDTICEQELGLFGLEVQICMNLLLFHT